jgi:hypothetical protein
MLSEVPPALAATAPYGGVAVGTMTAIMTLVSGPLYAALGPRAFWVMARALCGCVADRVCDAQYLDQSIGVESDLVDTRLIGCQQPPWHAHPRADPPLNNSDIADRAVYVAIGRKADRWPKASSPHQISARLVRIERRSVCLPNIVYPSCANAALIFCSSLSAL